MANLQEKLKSSAHFHTVDGAHFHTVKEGRRGATVRFFTPSRAFLPNPTVRFFTPFIEYCQVCLLFDPSCFSVFRGVFQGVFKSGCGLLPEYSGLTPAADRTGGGINE